MVNAIIRGSSSIFIVCFIGIVGASKLARANLEGEELGIGGSPLATFSDEFLIEELSFRGYGPGGFARGFGRPGIGGFGPGPFRRPLPFSRRSHLRGPGAGVGGVGGVGAIGGVKNKEAALDAVELENRQRDHNEIEGAQGGLLAAGSKLDVGHQTNIRNNNDGIHSHSNFDKDKLIVKERNRGSNDLDVVHNSNDISSGSHLGKASGVVAAQGSQGRIESDRQGSQSLGSVAARENENSALGALV